MVALDVALSDGMPFIFDYVTSGQVEARASPLLLLASSLFSSSSSSIAASMFLLMIIPLLACYGTHTYLRYLELRQQRARELFDVWGSLAGMQLQIEELEGKIARDAEATKDFQWLPPNEALMESVSDCGRQFEEFGEPPPLDSEDDFELPSPAIDAKKKHAAIERFYNKYWVRGGIESSEDEEELGPVARGRGVLG